MYTQEQPVQYSFFAYPFQRNSFKSAKKEQNVTKGYMTHDSYCWLGALPILSVSKTIDPSYKSYGPTRPYKHGTAYLLFFLANSHSNQDDLNPAVVIGLIKENDLQLDAEAVGNVDERPKYSNSSKKRCNFVMTAIFMTSSRYLYEVMDKSRQFVEHIVFLS